MVKTKDIIILGRPLQLQERSKAQMKGVTIGDSLAYKFYDGEFHGMSLLFAEPKGKIASPRSLSVTASNLTSLLQRPTVFLLPNVRPMNGKGSSIRMFISSHLTNTFTCRCFWLTSVFARPNRQRLLHQ